ncbi:MAG: hypothetical protein J7L66_03165, partial [Anaerolineaceae bacterium]|nr:hypothetical protein [Anaerolineaceae bacterium]
MNRSISYFLKAAFQLDLFENLNYLIYQFLLKTNLYQLTTPVKSKNVNLHADFLAPFWFNFWSKDKKDLLNNHTKTEIITQAESILAGKIRLFGVIEADLNLSPNSDLHHWSQSRSVLEELNQKDIKLIWEPARFSWAIRLGQAYFLTKEEKYAVYFWDKFAEFYKDNPVNCGPNWQSAQEVALRLIALVITLNFLKEAKCSSEERKLVLFRSIADHADRIPPTIFYAKAQNNNHLISEAVGLFTAGIFLPNHPHAQKWKKLGFRWFTYAIKKQIPHNGEYIQHSTNYQRMMLTLALWMNLMLQFTSQSIGKTEKFKLSQATDWLIGQLDPKSGRVPNLGHNDGTLILPFSIAPYSDYRPIIQAASYTFKGKPALKNGHWNDLSPWLCIQINKLKTDKSDFYIHPPIPRIGNSEFWGSIR